MAHVAEFIWAMFVWLLWIWAAVLLAAGGVLACYGVCRCLEGRRRPRVSAEELESWWLLDAAQDGPRRVR